MNRHDMNRYLSIAALALIMGGCGWLVAGAMGALTMLSMSGVMVLLMPHIPPSLTMRMFRARPIGYADAPDLYGLLAQVCRRADVRHLPVLYYLRSPVPNAVSAGSDEVSAVALSDGLLSSLDEREMKGVLAHELAHIVTRDVQYMRIADMLVRATGFLCNVGLILIIFLYLTATDFSVSLWVVAALAFAPQGMVLIVLAMSREREFAADEKAVLFTDDPAGLASALQKLHNFEHSRLARVFGTVGEDALPSSLRSHPSTSERIDRLMHPR